MVAFCDNLPMIVLVLSLRDNRQGDTVDADLHLILPAFRNWSTNEDHIWSSLRSKGFSFLASLGFCKYVE